MGANMLFGVVALGLVTLMLVACEGGFRVGRRPAARPHPKAFDNAMNWQGAVLGLAALLIGFTFAMAVTRFDARKQVLLAEANAVGTMYHRALLLDDSDRPVIRQLLRRYVDLRVALYDVSTDRARADPLERATLELQGQIWSRLAAIGRADPRSITNGLVLEAATDMFERSAERRDMREMPVPPTVFVVVILVSAIAVASIGYALGLSGRRMTFGMLIIPLLVAGVIMLVIDIAHPSLGIVRVPDLPMVHVLDNL